MVKVDSLDFRQRRGQWTLLVIKQVYLEMA
jgi:hypothetical protein